MKRSVCILLPERHPVLVMVHQPLHHSRLQSELQAPQGRVPNLQTVYTSHLEMQMVLDLEVQQLQSLQPLLELHLGLELEIQATRFFIQISAEQLVLVLQPLEMKPLDCTPHLELQLVKELVALVPQSFIAIFVQQVHLVVRQLQTKQLDYTLHQEMQVVLEMVIHFLLSKQRLSEPQVVQELEHRTIRFCTRILEPDMALARQPPATQRLVSIRLHVQQLEMVMVQNHQHSCFQLLELHRQVRSVARVTLPFMEIYVLQLHLAVQLLVTLQLLSTQDSGQLQQMDRVLSSRQNL
jgi:hypothetical protein